MRPTLHPVSFLLMLAVLLASVLLASCATPSAMPVPSAIGEVSPAGATPTMVPTGTPEPTQTLSPSLTPAVPPTATATLAPTATLVPTLDPALSDVKLIGLAWYRNYDLLLSFQFKQPVDPKKYRVTLEDKEYACEVLAQYPNRLYCRGQGAKVLTTANVRVYQVGSDQPGFKKDVWVPFFP